MYMIHNNTPIKANINWPNCIQATKLAAFIPIYEFIKANGNDSKPCIDYEQLLIKLSVN